MKHFIIASLLTVFAFTGLAHAETNHQISLGYQNNKVNDTDGITLDVNTKLPNQMIVGLNTQFDNSTLNTYGVYTGIPFQVQSTPFVLTPSVGLDRYREEKATVGNVGFKVGYMIDTKTSINTQAKYSKSFSGDDDLEGGSYTVGITRNF